MSETKTDEDTEAATDAEAEPKTELPEETVTITLDGREVSARKGELVIATAQRHGNYIPRFCYHERMTPVGMCRMCLVEIDTGRGPALQPSCMVESSDGMTVVTDSPAAKKAQEGVLEFLLVNHPLDCPVCDKGGECPLQDQTMAYGPGESRFLEEKRHYEKPIPVSDLVLLDRERCILCDRCTRFADEVAGDPLIQFIGRGNETQVNTFPDHPFSSYFSGNTVQICPVGALTATAYRFKARPWDLTKAESTCTSCSVGCRVTVQASRNKVLRYEGVDDDAVNRGWLCDKGRFDFEAVNSEDRLGAPLLREEGLLLEPTTWSEALRRASRELQAGIDRGGAEGVAVLGGARLTNEDAYAWVKLTKGVIGTDNVDCQLGDGLPPELVYGLPRATIEDACRPGGVVVLMGCDPKEELPVFYLRLRHAVLRDGVTLIELSPTGTATSHLAAHSLRYRPGELAELLEALLAGSTHKTEVAGVRADVIEDLAPLLSQRTGEEDKAGEAGGQGESEEGAADSAESAPASSADPERPMTVVLGRVNLASPALPIAAAAKALHEAHPGARFLSGLRRGNVHGALDMGMTPGLLPGGVAYGEETSETRANRTRFAERWPRVPVQKGMNAEDILRAAAGGKIDTLVLVGADPLNDFPDRTLAERALAGARTVIAADLFLTDSARQADVVFPAAGYAEVDGTTTNLEGRISNVVRQVTPPGTAQSDWVIASELARLLGYELGLESVTQIWQEIAELAEPYAAIGDLHVSSDRPHPDGPNGQLLPSDGVLLPLPTRQRANGLSDSDVVKRELMPLPDWEAPHPPPVDAYSFRLVVTRKLYDRGTSVRHSPALAGLVEGAQLWLSPQDFEKLGILVGEDMRVVSSKGHLIVPTHPSEGVTRGTALLHANQGGGAANSLLDSTAPVTDIRIERP